MEITARPRRRGRVRLTRVLLVTAALVSVALLVPPALGLDTHVVGDDAVAGTYPRGTLVLDEHVAGEALAVGDVVSFAEPGGDGLVVTRRVHSVDDGVVRTRGDGGVVDPWRVGTIDVERVVVSVPLLGYPLLAVDAVTLPPWAPGGVLLLVAGTLVLLRARERRSAPEGDDVPVGEIVAGVPPLGQGVRP